MSKREKIILAITFVVALGAGIYLLIENQFVTQSDTSGTQKQVAKSSKKQLEALKNNDIDMPADIEPEGTITLSERNRQLLEATSKSWPEPVFFRYQQGQHEEIEPKLFVYTGFMLMQGEEFAIINGKPFKKQEYLYGTSWNNYKVKEIKPNSLTLLTPDQETISVPLHKNIAPLNQKKKKN